MKRFFSFFIAVVALLISVFSPLSVESLAKASLVNDEISLSTPILSDDEYYPNGYTGYKYPVRPGMEEWYMLQDHSEMIKLCSIPEEILTEMSATELAETVLAYPLLADIYAYDNTDLGLSVLCDYCNSLEMLISSEESVAAFASLYLDDECISFSGTAPNRPRSASQDFYENNARFYQIALSSLVHSRLIAERLPEETQKQISIVSNHRSASQNEYEYRRVATGYRMVSIPGGKTIVLSSSAAQRYITYANGSQWGDPNLLPDFPTDYKTILSDRYFLTYGIRPISPATVKYNCHSYAWYNRSTANTSWLDDPAPYIASGKYIAVSKIEAVVGDIIVYYLSTNGNCSGTNHSAVIKSIKAYPRSNRTFTVVSKWGALGLYEHTAANCPYSIVNRVQSDRKFFHKK